MNDIGTVDVQTPSQQLVHEILAMVVCQVLSGVDNSVHVCLHQVGYNVDIFVSLHRWWFLHIDKSDDVLVIEEFYSIYEV